MFEKALLPIILLLVPLLVLLEDRTLIFNYRGGIDPWVYYGLYRNLAALKTLFPMTYYPSRLSLILPGYLVNQVFAPLTANYVLHLLIWLGAVAGLYVAVQQIAGRRSGLVAATVFGFFPYLWRAVGWDYPDGIGNAYYLLTMAFLTLAARSQFASRRYLFLAGITCAGALYCNLTWAFLLPSFGPYWLFLRKARGYPLALGRTLLGAGAGFLFLSLVFAIVNYRLSGFYLFYLPSITYAIGGVQTPSPYGAKGAEWILHSPWLYLPIAAVLAGLVSLVRFRWHKGDFHARMVLGVYVNLLLCAAALTAWELAGQPLLQIPYYASYLLAPTFLFLGVAVFPVSEKLTTKTFCLFLVTAIAACSWVWWDSSGRTWLWLFRSPGVAGVVGIAAVVAGSAIRWRTWAVAMAVLGVSVLSLTARSPVTDMWGKFDGSSDRAEAAFLRIVQAIEICAEAARPAQMLRFWYDNGDKNGVEFSSINSSYLYAYTKVPADYPTPPDSPGEGLVAILSSLPDPERRDALVKAQESLRNVGLAAHVLSEHVIDRGGVRYGLTIVRQTLDMTAVRALGYVRNGGFESGMAPWSGGWAKTRVVKGQSGMGLELEAEQGAAQYVMQWNFARLERGRKYKLVAWTKSGSSGDEPFVIGVWDNTASRFVADKHGRTSGEWQPSEVEFVNDSDNLLSLELIKSSPSKGTMLFDSVTFTEVQ